MTDQEAKLILDSYTLNNPPANDPRFNEALAHAASDPQLRAWWDKRRQSDLSIRRALRAAAVPADLRAALGESLQIQSRRRSGFARTVNWLAIAACLALVSYLYFQYGIDRSDDYQGPLPEMAYAYSVDGPRLKYFDRDTQKLKDWLVANGFDLPESLPPKLLEQEGIGCRPLKWSAQRVALLCFDAETVYHLFVGYRDDFPSFAQEIDDRQDETGWSVSQWQDGDYVFVLTAKAPVENLRRMLAGGESLGGKSSS